jgi:two-component system nitrate/nitrite response regulator NarL
MYSIFIVARIQIYREGIAALFTSSGRFEVRGTATCLSAALHTRAHAVVADCSIISPRLLTQYWHSRSERSPIIVFGVPDNINVALALLEAGASAYVSDDSTAAELCDTVLAVIEGSAVLPAVVADALLGRLRERSMVGVAHTFRRLTARELQVAELMGDHRSNKEIAAVLGISVHTVKIHVHHVIEKLALDRRSEVRDTLIGVGLSSQRAESGPTAGTRSSRSKHDYENRQASGADADGAGPSPTDGLGAGQRLVVVRAGESPVYGEGGQQVAVRMLEDQEDVGECRRAGSCLL